MNGCILGDVYIVVPDTSLTNHVEISQKKNCTAVKFVVVRANGHAVPCYSADGFIFKIFESCASPTGITNNFLWKSNPKFFKGVLVPYQWIILGVVLFVILVVVVVFSVPKTRNFILPFRNRKKLVVGN